MTTQTTTGGAYVALLPITRRAASLTVLGEQMAALIAQQRALPEDDVAGRAQLDREINQMLELAAQP